MGILLSAAAVTDPEAAEVFRDRMIGGLHTPYRTLARTPRSGRASRARIKRGTRRRSLLVADPHRCLAAPGGGTRLVARGVSQGPRGADRRNGVAGERLGRVFLSREIPATLISHPTASGWLVPLVPSFPSLAALYPGYFRSPLKIPFDRNRSVIFCVASMKCGWARAPKPARARERNVVDLLDLPRARRHHDHAVGEQHRLVDAVGDEQHGLSPVAARASRGRSASARGSARRARRTARPSAAAADRGSARARWRRAGACRRTARAAGGRGTRRGRPWRGARARAPR